MASSGHLNSSNKPANKPNNVGNRKMNRKESFIVIKSIVFYSHLDVGFQFFFFSFVLNEWMNIK